MSFDDVLHERQNRKKRVEALARELDRLIRRAELEDQEKLREAATALITRRGA